MNIFDKFLHSVSYKFPKGYPDMSSPTDILLLESLISEVLGQSISLNEGSMKQNTVKAIQTILNSELGKKYNFKPQTNWSRLGNMDKISPDQFLEIIKNTFNNPQVTILKPKEGENPSSKYNMYLFTTSEGPVKIILSGGANLGEKYESNFYDKIKSSAGTSLEDITDPDLRELYNKIGIDPEDITPEQVIQTGNKGNKRPIDFNGPENKGKTISDITILPDTYLSIKNVAGSGFYNGGIIPFIVFEDGKIKQIFYNGNRVLKPSEIRLPFINMLPVAGFYLIYEKDGKYCVVSFIHNNLQLTGENNVLDPMRFKSRALTIPITPVNIYYPDTNTSDGWKFFSITLLKLMDIIN
jgi:hypothetical protein